MLNKTPHCFNVISSDADVTMGDRIFGRVGVVAMANKVTPKFVYVYRIKHLPTGLYFIPSRKVKVTKGNEWGFVKSNLSKTGKVYAKKPSMKFLGDKYYTHLNVTWRVQNSHWESPESGLFSVVQSEWVIEAV